jgi:hypothetical protein
MEDVAMSEDARDRVLRALMGREEAELWAPYLDMLGLGDEEMVKRLVRILVAHLLLDRAMTELLTLRLLESPPKQFEQVQEVIAKLGMRTRIDLARTSQVISDSTADKIQSVNATRNDLAHYVPKKGWELTHIQELSSQNEFDQFNRKAREAIAELVRSIKERFEPFARTDP